MTELTFSFFGAVQITHNGRPPATRLWAKTQALLAYLAVETGHSHRREFLAGLLWPEQAEAQARNSLRQALYQLQKSIPLDCLEVTAQTLQFNQPNQLSVDVATFSKHLQICAQHHHHQRSTCSLCLKHLQQAINLYQGDFLSQLFLKDATPFEEWALLKREQFRRQTLSALRDLSWAYARRGNFRTMEETARHQLELDPFDETACRLTMQALAWQNQRNAAIVQYEAFTRLLQKELGVLPEPETTTVAQSVKAGTLSPPLLPKHLNWPSQLTTFIGRKEEMWQVREQLQTPPTHLLTISGTGGVGKTRLALQVAQAETFAFNDGACFVPLAGLSEAKYLPFALIEALKISPGPEKDVRQQLLAYLESKNLLLILDNFEHLLPDTSLINDILISAPRVIMLITSRIPLNLYGEQEFRLYPFSAQKTEAVELFIQRAQAIQPLFQPSAENMAQITALCAQLDGLPLAIELAIPHLKHLSLAELSKRLQTRLTTLNNGPPNIPLRHQTLRNTIAWSYNLLSPNEQTAFCALSVFAGSFSVEAAIAVSLLNLASALVEKNLLQVSDPFKQEARFIMLESLRDYGLEQLAQNGQRAPFHHRHANYFAGLAQQADREWDTAAQPNWQARLQTEQDNIRAALSWCNKHKPALGLNLALGMYQAWYLWGHYQEGISWFKTLLAQLPQTSLERGKGLSCLGLLLQRQQDYEQARPVLAESLAFFKTINDSYWIATILMRQADDLMRQHNFLQAEALAREAANRFENCGTPRGVSWALGSVAMNLHNQGKLASAQTEMTACINAARQSEDKRHLAWMLVISAEMNIDNDDFANAEIHLQEAHLLLTAVNDRPGLVYWSLQQAWLFFEQDDCVAAKQLLLSVLSLAHETVTYLARLLTLLVIIHLNEETEIGYQTGVRLWETIEANFPEIRQQLSALRLSALNTRLKLARTGLGEDNFTQAVREGKEIPIYKWIEDKGADLT